MTFRVRRLTALLMLAASTVFAAFVAVDGGTASVAATGQRVSNAKGAVVW